MEAIEIYCEIRKRRIKVGRLTKDVDSYLFEYADKWLKFESAFDIGPDLPMSRKKYKFNSLPESFASRIPPRSSANYARYCAERGISTDERNEMVLLATIAHKGPSSFVFEKSFELQDSDLTRDRLTLLKNQFPIRTIATLFNISTGSLQKILAGEMRGPSFQLIELCLIEKSAFYFKLDRAYELSDEIRLELKIWAKNIFCTGDLIR